jgi:hypothetical protein
MVIASFLRLITHPKIFVYPTPISEALRSIDAILNAPGVEQPALGPEWPEMRKLCNEKALAANDMPDAWLAAAAIHQGEHVVSFDSNFKRLLSKGQFTVSVRRVPSGFARSVVREYRPSSGHTQIGVHKSNRGHKFDGNDSRDGGAQIPTSLRRLQA